MCAAANNTRITFMSFKILFHITTEVFGAIHVTVLQYPCPLASDVSPSLLTDPLPNLPTSSASTIFSTCTDSNWDLHFQLPEFSSAIVHKLQTGSPPLKEAERSAMLEAIYNAVKVYTYYPKTMQYERIIQKLFKVYPKLANQPNMSRGDVQIIFELQRIGSSSIGT
ncbi:uncharacterized protein [Apostichopus japonicus]|uniref:uncharacterized protein n=1 Tax=Stichopus japonicus TaxID=307972 RepID=UPI003AB44CBF